MDNILQLIKELEATNAFANTVNDPTLQFEYNGEQMLFSTLLPEKTVESNSYRDSSVRFKTLVANDGTRYSPPVKKNAMLLGSVAVELGESDIAAELAMEQYEAFIKMLNRGLTQDALATVLRFFSNGIASPLALLRERHRVDCIVKAEILRQGNNKYEELVKFSNPAGHRVTVADWGNAATDILGALKTKKKFLADKGYKVNRIITTDDVLATYFVPNTGMKNYGVVRVQAPGNNNAVELAQTSEIQYVYNALGAIGLPQPETYDLGYSDDTYHRFIENKLIMVCSTGLPAEINLGDNTPLVIQNTLGYTGIGTATGNLSPGIASKVESFTGKDARIEAQGWQTEFPVLLTPEAVVVFNIAG